MMLLSRPERAAVPGVGSVAPGEGRLGVPSAGFVPPRGEGGWPTLDCEARDTADCVEGRLDLMGSLPEA